MSKQKQRPQAKIIFDFDKPIELTLPIPAQSFHPPPKPPPKPSYNLGDQRTALKNFAVHFQHPKSGDMIATILLGAHFTITKIQGDRTFLKWNRKIFSVANETIEKRSAPVESVEPKFDPLSLPFGKKVTFRTPMPNIGDWIVERVDVDADAKRRDAIAQWSMKELSSSGIGQSIKEAGYTITFYTDGHIDCTCPSASVVCEYGELCHHADAILNLIVRSPSYQKMMEGEK